MDIKLHKYDLPNDLEGYLGIKVLDLRTLED